TDESLAYDNFHGIDSLVWLHPLCRWRWRLGCSLAVGAAAANRPASDALLRSLLSAPTIWRSHSRQALQASCRPPPGGSAFGHSCERRPRSRALRRLLHRRLHPRWFAPGGLLARLHAGSNYARRTVALSSLTSRVATPPASSRSRAIALSTARRSAGVMARNRTSSRTRSSWRGAVRAVCRQASSVLRASGNRASILRLLRDDVAVRGDQP